MKQIGTWHLTGEAVCRSEWAIRCVKNGYDRGGTLPCALLCVWYMPTTQSYPLPCPKYQPSPVDSVSKISQIHTPFSQTQSHCPGHFSLEPRILSQPQPVTNWRALLPFVIFGLTKHTHFIGSLPCTSLLGMLPLPNRNVVYWALSYHSALSLKITLSEKPFLATQSKVTTYNFSLF